MKGIILAGGTGSRLWPITKGISKQLLPIHNKPMIYYPLGTLMLAGIRDILIITTPGDQVQFKKLLGNGDSLGVSLSYEVQYQPNGLAEAFLIGEKFLDGENCCLILGDNIFHGTGLGHQLSNLSKIVGAHIFGYKVNDPSSYGIVEFDSHGGVVSLEEKPVSPKSNFAIPGLYFYDSSVCEIAKSISKSPRGELEITSVNEEYLRRNELKVTILERGTAWLDTGTFDGLYAASSYIKIIEERQGNMVCCLEEIAWRNGWIADDQLGLLIENMGLNSYRMYLEKLQD